MKDSTKGILLVVMSALFWGVTGNVGSYLFNDKLMTPSQFIVIRLIMSGILLLIVHRYKSSGRSILKYPNSPDIIQLILFGVFGILFMQFFFFSAISESNAPTATIMQYTGPFVVILYLSIRHRVIPRLTVIIALFMALAGTALLLTHGDFTSLSISPLALRYGVLSVVGYAIYNIMSVKLLLRYDTTEIAGIAMLIGGIVLFLITRPFGTPFILDGGTIIGMAFGILFGTVFPFVAYLEGAKLIGPPKASVISTLEPLFSTIVAVLFLGAQFYNIDYIGIGMVMIAVIMLSLPDKKQVHETELEKVGEK